MPKAHLSCVLGRYKEGKREERVKYDCMSSPSFAVSLTKLVEFGAVRCKDLGW
jgi:hypothetical protein